MLKLVFKPFFGAEVVFGPLSKIVVLQRVLTDPASVPLADYQPPYWVVRKTGLAFVTFEVAAKAFVVLTPASGPRKSTGPHPQVRFADGAVYAHSTPICRFDAGAGAWIETSTSSAWPAFEIMPLSSS